MTVLFWINNITGFMIQSLIWPFSRLEPIWSLLFLSLLTALLMLWIVGKVSNQQAIKRTKNQIFGNLIGVKLYQNDLGVMFHLQWRIILGTLGYLRLSLTPLMVMLVPILLIMAQMHSYYGIRPLVPGEKALIKLKVKDAATLMQKAVSLKAREGLLIQTPPVRIPALAEVDWEVQAVNPGDYQLMLNLGEYSLKKQLIVSVQWQKLSSKRLQNNPLQAFMYPGESAITPGDPVLSVEVQYPPALIDMFGLKINWIILFFIFTLGFAYLFKSPMGVQI